MIGSIEEILDNEVIINLNIDITAQPNLINYHVVFDENTERKVVAQIVNTNKKQMKVVIVGEINNDVFTPGTSIKPSFKSQIRLIDMKELELIFGTQENSEGYTTFGVSNIYEGYKINVALNSFFNSHFAILGNTGSGKSCTVASIIQALYYRKNAPVNSSLLFFDAYGEYTNAFKEINKYDQRLNYKVYTTNLNNQQDELLQIPPWLLDIDDLALLLEATTPAQLPIIEKTLKLVKILSGTGENVIKRKNDIIARALQDILLSGDESTKIRDQVVGVLAKFNTPTLNLETQIVQPGYTRTLKQCLYIDKTGKMQEMELVVEFVRSYITDEELSEEELNSNPFYSLNDLCQAMEFALINEGILKSNKVFDIANIMNVRLHSLATGENRHYFTYPTYVTKEQYIESLLIDKKTNKKSQIVNFNINYVDDRIAKVITKIISKMIFLQSNNDINRGKRAFHIIIEEAHRYVQRDRDVDVIGYNIFERIAKEGRKYGVFIALITQRPSELSDTCISQCANFIILRTIHPTDLQYIKEMVPNITTEIVLQLKNLKPGNCIAFGKAFKVPTSLKVNMPNPQPLSNDVDIDDIWYVKEQPQQNINQQQYQQNMDVSSIMQQQVNLNNGQYIQQNDLQKL